VPAFAALFVFALARTTKAQKLLALKKTFGARNIISVAIVMFSLYLLIEMITAFFALQLDFFLAALLLFVVISVVSRFITKKIEMFFGVLAVLLAALNWQLVFTIDFALGFVWLLIIVLVLLFFVLHLGISAFGRSVKIAELKEGMVLLEDIVENNNVLEKRSRFAPSLINIFAGMQQKHALSGALSGLTWRDIGKIKIANADGRAKFSSVLVQETLPFAPILFLGAILYLLFGQIWLFQ
jgi:hypothetical protein